MEGSMDLPALLHTYGYLLIFAGTLVEGESLLALGGYFAHQGYLDLGWVIAIAFAGAVCGDQLFFWLGRHHAKRLLARFPKMRAKVNLALGKIERHQIKVMLGMRFLWGMRIALPIALGLSKVRAMRFLWINVISAAVWSTLFSCLGYGASHLFTQLVADLRRYEHWIAGVLVGLAAIALLWHLGRPSRKRTLDDP
jgi:membrane protein DedA with SNARE-associated domain